MYRRVLDDLRNTGDWLFVYYDDVIDGHGIRVIEEYLGVQADRSFPEPSLRRSRPEGLEVGLLARSTYAELCELSGHFI
jgi:hypothetical protein